MDLDQLRAEGYAVAEQVVPTELVAAVVAAIEEHFPGAAGMLPLWGHQALWDVRQHRAVHAVFAAAYGRDDLWVSLDRVSVCPPGAGAMAVHWDRDPAEDAGAHLQGVVALSDAPAGAGGFRCVPELFRDRAGWRARHPGADAWDIDLEGIAPTPVPVRAGDLIVFDAMLPHGTEANGSPVARLAQYVTMTPAEGDPSWRVELHQEGRSPFYGERTEPWPPARLSPLGRRLLGLDRWPGRQPTL